MKRFIRIFVFLGTLFSFVFMSCSGGEGNPITGNGGKTVFNNMVHTPIYVYVGYDFEFYDFIDVDESLEIDDDIPDDYIYFETYGEYGGFLTGEVLYWDYDLTEDNDKDNDLYYDDTFFFLRFRNNGYINLSPLYVNYDNADETVDDILIPNNNVNYDIGYYHANPSITQVRAYFDDTSLQYVWAQDGNHFNFDMVDNQTVDIWWESTGKISAAVSNNSSSISDRSPDKNRRTLKAKSRLLSVKHP